MPFSIPKLPSDLPTTRPKWVGRSVKSVEGPLLLTGQAEFTDNLKFPGMLHCAFARSLHAHARIVRIDTSAADRLPGVVAVITGADAGRETERPPGYPPGFTTHCLAVDKVRFAGEPVAAVAAVSRYVAEDAVDLIEVEYELLPPVVDARSALEAGSPLLYEERGTNAIYQRHFKWGDVDAAFAGADLVVTGGYRFPRISGNPMETNGCIVRWDPFADEVTAWGPFQGPMTELARVARLLRLPTNRVRLIGQPHGGSFGSKVFTRYVVAAALLSKRAGGRSVKWIEDRIEHLRAGESDAWERSYEGALAFTKAGKATAFRIACLDDWGASCDFAGMALKPIVQFTGPYEIPACEYDLSVVATNKNPQGAYRGYGPPPQDLLLEWLMDQGARELDLDPAEIRRRNYIPPDKFPYTLPTGNEYDSGNYQAALDTLLEMSGYRERRRAQAEARGKGRLVGLGLVSTIEVGVPAFGVFALLTAGVGSTSAPEGAVVRIDASGNILVQVGFPWEGQGQHTFVTQLMADYFGVLPGQVTVKSVDTSSAPPGLGPIGSRQAVTLSGAVLGAAELVREKLARAAAALLEADPADVELKDGKLGVRGVPGRAISVAAVAEAMRYGSDSLAPEVGGSPEASYIWDSVGRTLPDELGRSKSHLTAANAAHLVEVEVDAETGAITILGYWIADDCGTRLNPAVVEGMVQGGVAQGIGAVLLEEYAYNSDGERLTSTFMDYLLPTIHEVPLTEKRALTTPSPFTPLGAKGAGESAIHTTPAALYCAVSDALSPLGVRVTQLPMSPSRVWEAIQTARRDGH